MISYVEKKVKQINKKDCIEIIKHGLSLLMLYRIFGITLIYLFCDYLYKYLEKIEKEEKNKKN